MAIWDLQITSFINEIFSRFPFYRMLLFVSRIIKLFSNPSSLLELSTNSLQKASQSIVFDGRRNWWSHSTIITCNFTILHKISILSTFRIHAVQARLSYSSSLVLLLIFRFLVVKAWNYFLSKKFEVVKLSWKCTILPVQ